MRLVFLFFFYQVYGQRSLIFERACQKNPMLAFCREKAITERSRVNNADTTVSLLAPTKPLEIILPPPVPGFVTETPKPEETTKIVIQTTATPKSEGKTISAPFGLVPLPKPTPVTAEEILEEAEEILNTTTKRPIKKTLESDTHVLVFVSEFCVIGRERFVRKCHGEIERNEIDFCKSYPPACSGTAGVIPVLSYCGRYFMEYPKLCRRNKIHEVALPFCFAFEKFCLPELENRPKVEKIASLTTPKPSLQRCEDVVEEAKKVCNPFPSASDTFNTLRCTQFFKNCKKFINWQ
ncbi:unnamed protein product, partial [Mesorhabditis belari]|uniref:Uncharacterized protein n=1 Tax=Mesorhabditis belari TaxID=2138241 RepID=A0AAF3EW35_9BILA